MTTKNKCTEHHDQAAEHHDQAASHHREAAKCCETGAPEKASHHAYIAQGHNLNATIHAEEACKQSAIDQASKSKTTKA